MNKIIRQLANQRYFCSKAQINEINKKIINTKLKIPEAEFNTEFICNPANRDIINHNIVKRKGVGNIDRVLELSKNANDENSVKELHKEISKIPNTTDPKVFDYPDEGKIIKSCNVPGDFDFEPKTFDELSKSLKLVRMDELGPVAGDKSYILIGDLAQLEEALIQYTISRLMKFGFQLISVPDILPTKVIERCGLNISGERNFIYSLTDNYGDDLSLSGTAEMSLASKLIDSIIPHEELPLKLAAVSRCFRAEISNNIDEPSIYRVHQFTKVEMFICTDEKNSCDMLDNLVEIQENLFKDLGLSFNIIDMASHELGAPANRKFDIEGWYSGKKGFGELSSTSNCTDYQSRRLNIKYKNDNELKFVHTLNGTACAVPRMLMAICETYQTKEGNIKIPQLLIPFMNGKSEITKQNIADMRIYKSKSKK
ncbi:hypothetical protein HCN44_004183 [Aphidius gifuensis]|uniref:serine--tRNA ligase n=1 Tax=Aphidius gifuensis TaxID=684658 RepID=A0A834Y181_APHGI|nr:hypothetical protein HCN44_004183 [Aphidius gifuensis]